MPDLRCGDPTGTSIAQRDGYEVLPQQVMTDQSSPSENVHPPHPQLTGLPRRPSVSALAQSLESSDVTPARGRSASPQNEIGHARPRRTSSLSESDRRLATYIFARAAVQRPAGQEEIAMLKTASESVAEAKQLLPFGRGNVEPDLTNTRNEGFYRATAMRLIAGLGLNPAQRSALAAYAGGGNCGEHADVVMHIQAAKLKNGDRLHDVNNWAEDHEAVVHEGGAGRPHLVLDAWGNLGALNVQDSKYHRDMRDLETLHTYTPETGRSASEQFRGHLQRVDTDAHNTFDLELERVRELNVKSVGARDPNVVDEGFAEQVRVAVAQTPAPVNNENALSAARSIGASERAAKKAAPTIIESASDLSRLP
jgi:hypothetical protein